MGMCIPNFYKPLVFSRKSHKLGDAKHRYVRPSLNRRLFLANALSRYLETAALVYSWYLDDCWNEESVASKMIKRVNTMHRHSFAQLLFISSWSHYVRYIAEKVRPIGSSELSESVAKVFKEANIDCEKEMTEQVMDREGANSHKTFLLHFQDKIMLSDIAAIRNRTEIAQEYYDYVDDSNAFSQVELIKPFTLYNIF